MNFGWATAYLDVIKVFSSHVFCSRWVVQSHNSILYIHLLVSEIVFCSTIPYSVRRWIPCEFLPVLPNENEFDSLDWFLRLKFLQIPLLTVCWIAELRSLDSKTKVVLTDRKNQKVKPSSTKGFTPFKCGGKSGKSAKSKNFDKVRHARVFPCLVFPRQTLTPDVSLSLRSNMGVLVPSFACFELACLRLKSKRARRK